MTGSAPSVLPEQIPILVLHARSLSERAAPLIGELSKISNVWGWVFDFDAADITAEIERRWFKPEAPLSVGQKSCAMKHVAALQRVRDMAWEKAIIFEDDVLIGDNFAGNLAQVLDEARRLWLPPFVIHLGSASNFYVPAADLRPGQLLYRGTRGRNSEAYVIGAAAATLRLDWLETHKISEPIDLMFNAGDAATGIDIIWTEPPLAEQGSLTGRFPSSLDPKQRRRAVLRFQFPIQKLRRKYLKRWIHAFIEKIGLPTG
jgi:glycosyl transferase, family 25